MRRKSQKSDHAPARKRIIKNPINIKGRQTFFAKQKPEVVRLRAFVGHPLFRFIGTGRDGSAARSRLGLLRGLSAAFRIARQPCSGLIEPVLEYTPNRVEYTETNTMIKVVIFDLDMCILDTHTLSGPFFKPVLDALYNSELSAELKNKINDQLWTTSLDDTMELFSVPEDLAERMREAYRNIEVPDGIKSFGDEEYIRNLPVKKILVTSGYRKFQETKITKLGIADLFDEIIIDALDDREKRKGKKKIFQEIVDKDGWLLGEVLVVGDNPMSELGAAKVLGISTVQTVRPTINKWGDANYHISSFSELRDIIYGA